MLNGILNLLFYPNPLQGNVLTIDQPIAESNLYINIIDFKGQKVDSFFLMDGNRHVHLKNSLSAGIYYVTGDNGKAVLFRKKMVKL